MGTVQLNGLIWLTNFGPIKLHFSEPISSPVNWAEESNPSRSVVLQGGKGTWNLIGIELPSPPTFCKVFKKLFKIAHFHSQNA